MMRTTLIAMLALAVPAMATGQSMQRVSIQGSGALVIPAAEESGFQSATRLGWEGQFRYTFSRFSLGAGYQRATVFKNAGAGEFTSAVSVLFVEPRYILTAGSQAALYVAGRGGVGQFVCTPASSCPEQAWELAFGGGGGVLVRLSERAAIDLGSQFFSFQYTLANPPGAKSRPGYVLARVGLSLGL